LVDCAAAAGCYRTACTGSLRPHALVEKERETDRQTDRQIVRKRVREKESESERERKRE
jgi:hypothetical protein